MVATVTFAAACGSGPAKVDRPSWSNHMTQSQLKTPAERAMGDGVKVQIRIDEGRLFVHDIEIEICDDKKVLFPRCGRTKNTFFDNFSPI